MFSDRQEAGRELAVALDAHRRAENTIVLGIPRGGVVVAAQVAQALELPLGLAIAAKVGAPGNPEYAAGAMAVDGEVSVNPSAGYRLSDVRAMAGEARTKIAHELRIFGDAARPDVAGRTVILADDGLATGLTALTAAEWLRRAGASRVVVAVPVASRGAVETLTPHADEVIALETPERFHAVGQFYNRFGQTEDAEVIALLDAAGE